MQMVSSKGLAENEENEWMNEKEEKWENIGMKKKG